MTSPITHEFVLGQENLVVALLQKATRSWSAFNSGYAAVEHWKWKHLDGPLGPSHISLSVDENRVIGGFHSIPLRFKIGDCFRLVTYDTDLAVMPDCRRRGLYYRLEALSDFLRKRAGIELGYWITWNPFMARLYERRFDRLPLKFARFIKVADVRRHLRMKPIKSPLIKFLGYRLLERENRLRNICRKAPASSGTFSISDVDQFDPHVEDFWREAAEPFTVIGERNRAFLNWRFLDPRAGVFTAKMATENGRMIAFMVIKIDRRNPEYPEGYIADMLALPGRLDASQALLCRALEHFSGLGINAVHCMLPTSSPYARVLMHCGFSDTRLRDTVFVKFMGNDQADLRGTLCCLSGPHHLSYADFDVI